MSLTLPCKLCGGNTGVLDSRRSDLMNGIRRRRICKGCGARFTTYECETFDVEMLEAEIVKAMRVVSRLAADLRAAEKSFDDLGIRPGIAKITNGAGGRAA